MKKIYFLLLFALSSQMLLAQTVRRAKVGGTGDGSTWALAGDLQTMINASASGDEVWVAAGTYYPTEKIAATDDNSVPTTERDQSFILRTGVKIYGGFVGSTESETLLSQRNYLTNVTILSGDLGTLGVKTDNAYHVVIARIGTTSVKAVLDGFTIQDGYANVTTTVTAGFGLDRNDGAAINLRGLDASGFIEFVNLKIKNNESTNTGGGLYALLSGTGTLVLNNVEFSANKGNSGGAMYLALVGTTNAPNVTITNSLFAENETNTHSGAIYHNNNSAGILKIVNSKFIDNEAKSGLGGAVYHAAGFMELYNSLFYANKSSASSAGAVYIGAVLGTMGTGTIVNSTFYQNTANTTGGAISFFAGATSATVTLYNNVFNGNVAGDGTHDLRGSASGILKFKNNLFQVYNIAAGGDDEFANNTVNASPTLLFASTTAADADFLTLATGSIALDAGANTFSTALLDLANNPRIRNSTIDLGAYEFQTGNFPLPVTLTAYTAVKSGTAALLTWKTESEQNNQKFIIERGATPTSFTFLKEVKGAGDSNVPLSYSVTDYAPSSGKNYYKLTQYDNDGKATVLGVQVVNFELIASKIIAYPNPAKAYVWVKLPASSTGVVSVNLISLTGKNILTNNYAPAASSENVKLDLTNIPSGSYILWLNKGKSNAEKQTLLVVQ